jgi:glycosyltransferase involved in cell wall biosynthesis
MQAADVFLALADLSNVGNPLLEAMCCGLPVAAVDAGETGELIRDRKSGRLLASGAASEVSRAIIELARNQVLRRCLAQEARLLAEERFWSWEARMQAELEEVERLVGQPVTADAAGAVRG